MNTKQKQQMKQEAIAIVSMNDNGSLPINDMKTALGAFQWGLSVFPEYDYAAKNELLHHMRDQYCTTKSVSQEWTDHINALIGAHNDLEDSIVEYERSKIFNETGYS